MMSNRRGWRGPMLVGLVIAVMVAGTGCAYQGDVKARAWAKAEAEPVATVFGCYAYAHVLGGVENWRKHVKLMKAHGMNTVAPFTRGPEDIAAQLDIMIEEGMLESNHPVDESNHLSARNHDTRWPRLDRLGFPTAFLFSPEANVASPAPHVGLTAQETRANIPHCYDPR